MKAFDRIAGAALLVLVFGVTAHAQTLALRACGTINRSGHYFVTNDLVLKQVTEGSGGDCLNIRASQVNLNLGGHTIYVQCLWNPFDNNSCAALGRSATAGAVGINVLSGANEVSINNGYIGSASGNFLEGIAGTDANSTHVNNVAIQAVVGIQLTNVNDDSFNNISYVIADTVYHGLNGPILSVTGNRNNFRGLVGADVGGDIGTEPAIVITGNHNLVDQANVSNFGVCDYAVQVSGRYNSITNSTVNAEGGCGLEVTSGSAYNTIEKNTVTVMPNSPGFALFDANANCGSDTWADNTFTNASPASCIQ